MRVIKKLNPGAPGTQRYLRQYQARLVCVRYRHDPAKHCRYTTVELIVDEKPLPVPRTDTIVLVK
jgi:hypothetical protein